jgi:asparaginyl-tRNA synthetase
MAAAAAARLLRLAPRRLQVKTSPLAALSFPFPHTAPLAAASGRQQRFCAAAQASAPAAAATGPAGDAVGEFRKRLRVADVKGGEDEGAAWVGKELAVRGWVRTCRAQRTVTFVEVRHLQLRLAVACVNWNGAVVMRAVSRVCFCRNARPYG